MYQGLELPAISLPQQKASRFSLKRSLKVLGIYGLFISVFGVAIKSPISLYYLVYVGYPLLFVYFTFFLFFFFDKLYTKGRGFTRYEWWVMFMFLYIIIVSGAMADIYYGQPMFTGMKSEKSWVAIFTGILIFYLLKSKAVDLSIVKDALLFGAWFQLPFFLTLVFSLNPKSCLISLTE